MNLEDYELIEDKDNVYNKEETKKLLTEYFSGFDYIIGDYSHNKLRLKGFCEENNERATEFNLYKNHEEYIKNYTVYDSKYFILKRK